MAHELAGSKKDHGRLLPNVLKALRAGGRASFNFGGEGLQISSFRRESRRGTFFS